MLTQEDYLHRQIRALAQALLAAWGRGGPAPASLDEAARGAAGLDPSIAARLAPQALLTMLSPGGQVAPERALPLGIALAAHGHRAHARVLIEAALAARPDLRTGELEEILG